MPLETQAVDEETKGPKVGAPPQALEGFLRKTGLTQDQLVERDGVYFAVVEKPGRENGGRPRRSHPRDHPRLPLAQVAALGRGLRQHRKPALGAAVARASSRCSAIMWFTVKLMGFQRVPRPWATASTIPAPSPSAMRRTMRSKLRAAHVIVDQEERRAIIRAGAAKAAADAGLVLVEDEGLVNENSGLTEWPVPMLGRFDPAFLAVPEEVIQLTARVNQKYFMCRDAAASSPTRLSAPPTLSRMTAGRRLLRAMRKCWPRG